MPSSHCVTRREVVRLCAGGALLSAAGCQTTGENPSINVPSAALTDEPIDITVEGLEPGTVIDVQASTQLRTGTEWTARARFDVGDDRTLAVPAQAPTDGTYESVDPMGLFWSKSGRYG